MITRVLTHSPKSQFLTFILFIIASVSIQAQDVSYTCQCKESLPNGVIEFKIRAFGDPGTDWRVENAVNLFEDAALTTPIPDMAMIPDVNDAGRYCLTGFSSDGILPTVDVYDGTNPAVALQMVTCRTPEVEIRPLEPEPATLCVGGLRRFCIEDLYGSLTDISWTATGSSSLTTSSGDRCADIEYDSPGTYVINVEGATITGCSFNDDLIVFVEDIAADFSLEGLSEIYTCADDLEQSYILLGSDGLSTEFNLYEAAAYGALGSAATVSASSTGSGTGSGSGPTGTMNPLTFPNADGDYILVASSSDLSPNSCGFAVELPIKVRTELDFVNIEGPSCTCTGVAHDFTLENSNEYSGISWSVEPATGWSISPTGATGQIVALTFTEGGTYTITAEGTADEDSDYEDCDFTSEYTVEVTDEQVNYIACNSNVNVSLNNNCELDITPDMILEGNHLCNDAYTLVISDADGNVLTGSITEDQLGNTLTVEVEQNCGDNSCWGYLTVEDKSITPLECPEGPISSLCFEFDDFTDFFDIVGLPLFDTDITVVYRPTTDNWIVGGHDNCSDVLLEYNDTSNSSDCATIRDITRTWTITDLTNGSTSSCTSSLSVVALMSDAIQWPANWDSALDQSVENNFESLDACNVTNPDDLPCTIYTLDEFGNPDPSCTGMPEGLLCSNLQIIGYDDTTLPVCGPSKKILRNWTVWDECQQIESKHTQIITLMNVAMPVCIAPGDVTFNTATHACTGDIEVPAPIITGGCLPVKYTVMYSYNENEADLGNFSTAGVTSEAQDVTEPITITDIDFSERLIWIRYVVTDECGDPIMTDGCTIEGFLEDAEQPIPACDLNNIVALNEDGCGYAGPSTFDDHSWDNCGIYQTVIQRMDQSICSNACTTEDTCELRQFDFMTYLGEYESHHYYLSKDNIEGDFAEGYAEALDGELADFDNADEREWLDNLVAAYTSDDYHASGSLATGAARYVVEFEDRCGWTQQEKFCCADIDNETMMMMRVIDNYGNHNLCMVNVKVRDYIAPIFESCPQDITVSCDMDVDFSTAGLNAAFGQPTASDFECTTPIITGSDHSDPRDECHLGSFRRSWSLVDASGNSGGSCSQRITFRNLDPFVEADITWPEDATVTTGCTLKGIDPLSLPMESRGATWTEKSCSNVVSNYSDLLFSKVDGACEKLVRTWNVVDWCNPSVIYSYDQVIKLENTTTPVVNCPSSPEYGTLINCQREVTGLDAAIGNGDACTSSTVWSHVIEYADGSESQSIGSSADGTFGVGRHTITYTLTDACGNQGGCQTTINVTDDNVPTPYCHGQLVIPMSESGSVEIWANDIDLGSQDECSGPVVLSFSETSTVTSFAFTCDDIGINRVVLYVIDQSGNVASCVSEIFIQDNVGACGTPRPVANIEGLIMTEDDRVIDQVEVDLMSNFMSNPQTDTAESGEYAFNEIPMYEDYQVNAIKNDSYLNGVSTLDLIMIQRHILGIESLDSPYKVIAADVNNSQRVDGLDLVELRKLILGIYVELPQNDSWRFVNSDQEFETPMSPWPYNENYLVENISSDVDNANFIGVKIGDVNLSAKSDAVSSSITNNDTSSAFEVSVQKSVTDKGNTRMQFIATADAELLGNQMSFDFEAEDLLAVIPMSMDIQDSNIAWDVVDQGKVKMSYDNQAGLTVNKGDVLFELLFKGEDVALNSNQDLAPEIYTEVDGKVATQTLEFVAAEAPSVYGLTVDQNKPNPFKDETIIGFQLENAGTVMFTLTDAKGQLIRQEQKEYEAGYNQITLNADDLGAHGVVYYQISSGNQTVTRKMIILK